MTPSMSRKITRRTKTIPSKPSAAQRSASGLLDPVLVGSSGRPGHRCASASFTDGVDGEGDDEHRLYRLGDIAQALRVRHADLNPAHDCQNGIDRQDHV